jgi:redox-sensitive bicupin YhaK (pirin superfamily)
MVNHSPWRYSRRMIGIRRAEERGRTRLPWLDSRHTFSFGEYHDPAQMGFRALRVINDDRVAPGGGFDTHPHRDMEIVTYVLDGALQHRDSLGNGSLIRPGEVQRMSAGTGIRHSEFNASRDNPVHLLQIWLLPAKTGIEPGYEQRPLPAAARGGLALVASPDGRDGSVTVHQDVAVYAGQLERGNRVTFPLASGRHAWLHVARGSASVNGHRLQAGDGAGVSGEEQLAIQAEEPAELLLFDLA